MPFPSPIQFGQMMELSENGLAVLGWQRSSEDVGLQVEATIEVSLVSFLSVVNRFHLTDSVFLRFRLFSLVCSCFRPATRTRSSLEPTWSAHRRGSCLAVAKEAVIRTSLADRPPYFVPDHPPSYRRSSTVVSCSPWSVHFSQPSHRTCSRSG